MNKSQVIDKTEEKVYRGDRSLNDWMAKAVTVNGKPLKHIVCHSSAHFEWGFSGCGAADLSLSILADYLGERRRAEKLHQQFKIDFVSKFAYEGWELTGDEIEEWLLGR